jgi:hypothetical protein
VIARTSRNTAVSTGPLGLFVLLIGGLLTLVAMAIVLVATAAVAGATFVAGEVRRRRAAPQIAARRS